ncbi:MAG: hypothetical protein FJX00_00450 [Alphaproteobacteria bacterium]|nr:hypothetical protein [Alphaproteobacteria bacterium]
MKKRTWKAAFTAALFGTCAITTSADSNLWMNSSHMESNQSSETSTSESSKSGSDRSKEVHVQTNQNGDAVMKKTIETITENGVKTIKTTEEYTKDGHTEVVTQTTTEKVKGRQCCGLKKIRKLKKWLNKLEHQAHHEGAQGDDCDEKCKQLDAGQWDRTGHTDAHKESKKMVQKTLGLDNFGDVITQLFDRIIDVIAVVNQKIESEQNHTALHKRMT